MANGRPLGDRVTTVEVGLKGLTESVCAIDLKVNSLGNQIDSGFGDLYKRIEQYRREDAETIRRQLTHLEDHNREDSGKVSKGAIYQTASLLCAFAMLVLAVGGIYTNSTTGPLKQSIVELQSDAAKRELQLDEHKVKVDEVRLQEITKLHTRELERIRDYHDLELRLERERGVRRDMETQIQGMLSNFRQDQDWVLSMINSIRVRMKWEKIDAPSHRFSVPDPRGRD